MNIARSVAAIRATFRDCMLADEFDVDREAERVVFASMQAFIAYLVLGHPWTPTSGPAVAFYFPRPAHLDMRLADLRTLRAAPSPHGHAPTVAAAVASEFCERHLTMLLRRTFHRQWAHSAAALLAELAVDDPRRWLDRLLDEPARAAISTHLAADLEAELGERSLISFFVNDSAICEHLGPAVTGVPREDSQEYVLGSIGAEILEVLIHAGRQQHPCRAAQYAWQATLALPGFPPHAAACGTVYVVDRFDRRRSRPSALSALSEFEMGRLDQFEAQHAGVGALLQRSDLCFVRA